MCANHNNPNKYPQVSHCLAVTCPIADLREELIGAANLLPEAAKHLLARKNHEYLYHTINFFILFYLNIKIYGVHFCTSDMLVDLQQIGFYVEIIDFGHSASNAKAMEDCYLQVFTLKIELKNY